MPIVNKGPCACCDGTLLGFYRVLGYGCSNIPFTWTSPSAGYCTSSTNMVKIRALHKGDYTVVFEAYFPAMVPSLVYKEYVYFDDVPFTYKGKCYKWQRLLFWPPGPISSSFPYSAVLSTGASGDKGWVEVACQ